MKKIIALITAVVLVFGCMGAAFAEDTKNYVVLGDSIALGSGIYNSEDACFGRIVANTNGYNYKNYAVNGHTTTQLLERMEATEIKNDIINADIISLSIGGNNYLQQNLPRLFVDVVIGKYDIIDDIEETLAEEFALIIETIKQLNPHVQLLVNTLYNPRFDLLRDFYDEAVVRVNRTVRGYLENNPGAYELIDVHSVFTADHPEYIAADSIHPSAVGNEVIAGMVLQKLYDLGLGENTTPVVITNGIDQIPFMSRILKLFRDMIDKVV